MLDTLFPNGTSHYLIGGLLIGVAVSFAFLMSGLVTGMSTVFTAAWSWFSRRSHFQQARFTTSRSWRLVLAVGLIVGGALFLLSGGAPFHTQVGWKQLAIGGFIAGFGARMSNGCTSGHGICGLASWQLPSLTAVLTFLATAMITARVVVWLGGA
jgi:uncharacterized membrane protein YedE/YeeE